MGGDSLEVKICYGLGSETHYKITAFSAKDFWDYMYNI